MGENIHEILKNWEIEDDNVLQKNSSIWEIGSQLVLKRYDDKNTIDRNSKISIALIDLGIPVAPIIRTKNDHSYFTINNNYYLLMKKLPGEHITDISDKEVGFKIGNAIGQLHLALLKCENILQFQEKDLLSDLDGWVKDNYQKNNWKYLDEREYSDFLQKLRFFYSELPHQIIHRDVHFGNFLFLNGHFTGYIDFDLSQKNIRIFDLCYFLAGLFTEKVGQNLTDEEWLLFVKETVCGYESCIKLTENEKIAFPFVMEGIELLCASYFINICNFKFAEGSLTNFFRIKKLENEIVKVIST